MNNLYRYKRAFLLTEEYNVTVTRKKQESIWRYIRGVLKTDVFTTEFDCISQYIHLVMYDMIWYI